MHERCHDLERAGTWPPTCTASDVVVKPPPQIPSAEQKRLVLVAEDDEDLRALIVATLRADLFVVVEVGDGAQALERLDAAVESPEQMPDVIVSDVRMPVLSGFGVLAALRRAHLSTPVILITAFTDPSFFMVAERLGAAGFLKKPFDMGDLLRAVLDARPAHERARAKFALEITPPSPQPPGLVAPKLPRK